MKIEMKMMIIMIIMIMMMLVMMVMLMVLILILMIGTTINKKTSTECGYYEFHVSTISVLSTISNLKHIYKKLCETE